jgi:hypothetical protein
MVDIISIISGTAHYRTPHSITANNVISGKSKQLREGQRVCMIESTLGGVELVVQLWSRSWAVQATTSSVSNIRDAQGDVP